MRIAVTGATGFLGRYIVRHLAGAGHQLRCWYRPGSDRTGFDRDAGSVDWLAGELGDAAASHALVQGADALVHAAVQWAGPRNRGSGSHGAPDVFLGVNLTGSLKLFQGAVDAGVSRCVFISTCAVHEVILDDRPLDETHPLWPTSAYGAHKAALEKFIHCFGLGQSWPICALRPTGIYGVAHPPQTSRWFDLVGRVVRGELIDSAKGGKEVHAADVARAVELLLTADPHAVAGQAYNCYDRYVSEEEVARIARELSGSASPISSLNRGPKHQIETHKIRTLGMTFGGEKLLRQTVEELVTSCRPGRTSDGPAPSCPDFRQTLSRRRFWQVGPVGLFTAGLVHTLAQRAGAGPVQIDAARRGTARACIILFQVGGPYQCDTFDPKPLAPDEVRGPFRTASTTVPGLHFTDAVPRIAQQAHRLAVVRSVYHGIRCHNPAIYCSLAGREATTALAVSSQTDARRSDHPHYASVLARLRPGLASMPHHVIIPDIVYNGPARAPGLHGGYLGARYDPFLLGGDPSSPTLRVEGTELPAGVDRERFLDRQSLLQQLDAARRALDGDAVANVDTFYGRAFDLLTSTRTRQAFELHQEPVAVRDRYGRHAMGQGALLGRRLVEAGVPFVTVFSHTRVEQQSWDTHSRHYELSRNTLLPPADQSLAALVDDLAQRGLLDSTLVVWMGEFGRSPRMGIQFSNAGNTPDGRDHWSNCYSVALAGGGVQGGQAIGASDGRGGYPREHPVHISDLAATIYHALGVDPRAQLNDIQGQLRYICDGNPVRELF